MPKHRLCKDVGLCSVKLEEISDQLIELELLGTLHYLWLTAPLIVVVAICGFVLVWLGKRLRPKEAHALLSYT